MSLVKRINHLSLFQNRMFYPLASPPLAEINPTQHQIFNYLHTTTTTMNMQKATLQRNITIITVVTKNKQGP